MRGGAPRGSKRKGHGVYSAVRRCPFGPPQPPEGAARGLVAMGPPALTVPQPSPRQSISSMYVSCWFWREIYATKHYILVVESLHAPSDAPHRRARYRWLPPPGHPPFRGSFHDFAGRLDLDLKRRKAERYPVTRDESEPSARILRTPYSRFFSAYWATRIPERPPHGSPCYFRFSENAVKHGMVYASRKAFGLGRVCRSSRLICFDGTW